MSDPSVPGDDEAARVLDRLGSAAVSETPPAPPAPPVVRRASRAPWFAAAAVVLALAAVGGWLVVARSDDHEVATVPDVTSAPTRSSLRTENMVDMDFDPVPATTADTLTVTVTNRSSSPWTFDCLVGSLQRWEDGDWHQVGFAMWTDEGTLVLYDDRPTPACSPTTAPIEPGGTVTRPLNPASTVRASRVEPLGPGRHQLLFADAATSIEAIGRFELQEPSTTTSVAAPNWTVAEGDPRECMLVSTAELRELTGVDPNQPTGPVTMSPQPCWVGDADGDASYRFVSADEARQFIAGRPMHEQFGPRPVGLAEDSLMVVMPSGGRGHSWVEGAIVDGSSGILFQRYGGGSIEQLKAWLSALAPVLAERLADGRPSGRP